MSEDVLAIGGFFFTAIVLSLGIPLVRSWTRRKEIEARIPPGDAERDAIVDARGGGAIQGLRRVADGGESGRGDQGGA